MNTLFAFGLLDSGQLLEFGLEISDDLVVILFLFIFGSFFGLGDAFSLLTSSLQVLFFTGFTIEHFGDHLLFLGLQLAETVTQFNDSDDTVLVTNGGQFTLHAGVALFLGVEVELDTGQGGVGHLVGVSELVLAVVHIPNIHPTVLRN